ncbi:hypothetical protein [Meiothermus sp. Pnk-1]|uniref:hypothetical protein n=1 Tax=Meiothermus sp. Pnk-1 TaxID=873128 RepID=UPI000D7D0182|nr:hypothetical protein [Meiothermus sp. Pnk-1]PZA08330.1 hypothetical protein DNA98_04120 [Meiothermus sp. Pnk-1]
MRIVAKGPGGHRYVFSGGTWISDGDDPLALATLALLNGIADPGGKELFPGVNKWSDQLPPLKTFEDNLIAARGLGLEVIEATPPIPPTKGDY